MRLRGKFIVMLTVAFLIFSGCFKLTGTDTEEAETRIVVRNASITGVRNTSIAGVPEEPFLGLSRVMVTIDRVQFFKHGSIDTEERIIEYIVPEDERQQDLLSAEWFVEDNILPVGKYGQIRLFISEEAGDNYVEKDGVEYDLLYNSGVENTGFRLVSGFEVMEGALTRLTIAFDVKKSIVVKNGPDESTYYLKPAVRLIEENEHMEY